MSLAVLPGTVARIRVSGAITTLCFSCILPTFSGSNSFCDPIVVSPSHAKRAPRAPHFR